MNDEDKNTSRLMAVSEKEANQRVAENKLKESGKFEDLLELCGTTGRWNIMLFLLLAFAGFPSPLQSLSYQFLGATPQHWCQVDELYEANWTDEQVLSLAIPFDKATAKYGICQMYDLNYTAAVQLGYEAAKESLGDSNATSLLTCPHRRFNLTEYASTLVIEDWQETGRSGMCKSVHINCFLIICFTYDRSLYLPENSEQLIGLRNVSRMLYTRLLPESPRWLILQGRHEEALKVLHLVAKSNGKILPADKYLLQFMENLSQTIQVTGDDVTRDRYSIKTIIPRIGGGLKRAVILFSSAELRPRTLIVFFCWFTVSMVYFGIALNAENLSMDIYIYIFLGGLLEIPSYFLLWFGITRFGRKKFFVVLFLLGAIFICLITAVILLEPAGGTLITLVLSQVGKFLITAAFNLAWVYTAELFPTTYRSLAIGQASVCARIGSIFSPYINDILGTVAVWAPSALFGGLSFIAAALAIALPETRDLDLPETCDLLSDNKKKDTHDGIDEDVNC